MARYDTALRRTAANLRFLAWSKTKDREKWSDLVRRWLGISSDRTQHARDCLQGVTAPSPEELETLVAQQGYSVEELTVGDLLRSSDTNILEENLRFLIGNLAHGEGKEAAATLGVHPTTLSTWGAAKRKPSSSNLKALVGYFGLQGKDLRVDPVFLSLEPVGHRAQTGWVVRRVSEMPHEELQQYYPALRRILGDG